jgi:DNA repair protein RadC
MKRYKPTKFELQVSEYIIAYKSLSNIKHRVTSADDAYKVIKPYFQEYEGVKEVFYTMYLDNQSNVIGIYKCAEGSISNCLVDVRLIVKPAIELLASTVILFHNHPSGNTSISQADKKITEQVKDGLNLFSIHVVDHIILTNPDYVSFANSGLL